MLKITNIHFLQLIKTVFQKLNELNITLQRFNTNYILSDEIYRLIIHGSLLKFIRANEKSRTKMFKKHIALMYRRKICLVDKYFMTSEVKWCFS